MSGLMSNDEFTQSHPELTARLRARAGMSRRDEIAARRAELVAAGNSEEAARAIEAAERERIATAATQQYRRGDVWRGLAKGSQPVANPETPPGSPTGAGRSEALTQSFGGEGDGSRESTVPVVHNLLYAEQRVLGAPDARAAMQRAQTREQDQARVRTAQRRAQQEWGEVMTASRAAQRQAAHSVDLTGSTIPFPDHDSDAVVSG